MSSISSHQLVLQHPATRSRLLRAGGTLFLLAAFLASASVLRAANLLPKVFLVEPADGATFAEPAQIDIACHVEDADGSIASVELLTEQGSLGKKVPDPVTASPAKVLHWVWDNPPAGEHKLVALATDNDGGAVYSSSVGILVKRADPLAPANLTITEPGSGAVLGVGEPITIKVTAVDKNGDIRHVEFFANNQSIGKSDHLTKDAVIPGRPREHVLEWAGAPVGQYRLTARATDTLGNPVEAQPVTIIVGTPLPMVSLAPAVAETSEPSPEVRVIPGSFTLKRSAGVEKELTVYLGYSGSATPDVDYNALPPTATFRPGEASIELTVAAIEDSLWEETESVIATLVDSGLDRVPDYQIDPENNTAKVLIRDRSPRSKAELLLNTPKDGEIFKAGETITLSATAVDPDGYIASVRFYDHEQAIGASQITFIRAPDPGTPIDHVFEWQNPPAGEHLLTVRALDSHGAMIRSKSVYVRVAGDVELPTVDVIAADAEATELPPIVDAIDPARFVFSRTGDDLSKDLVVLFSLHGTATPDQDYRRPERTITIPAGQSEATLTIVPEADDLSEPMETLGVRLEDPLPISSLPGPVTPYNIPPLGGQAVAVIFDQHRPEGAALELVLPDNGATYYSPQPIPLLAVAFHPVSAPTRVEFYAGDKLIGVSELIFIRPQELITHSLLWKEPAPGEYALTARTTLADGSVIASTPVNVTVRGREPSVVQLDVVALDSTASEEGPDGVPDPAVFSVRRVAGPTDVEVSVFYTLEGTAENGIDYAELDGRATLAAGQQSVEISVRPVPDKALEGAETVALVLQPPACIDIYPPPPSCYRIAGGTAKIVLLDRAVPATESSAVAWIAPQSGAVFTVGDPIKIHAILRPTDANREIQVFADDQVILRGSGSEIGGEWTGATVGAHVLTVHSLAANDDELYSEPVKILVRATDLSAVARRELPGSYMPGQAFKVVLRVDPGTSTSAYAIEDQPPKGWTVSDISEQGTYDPATGVVKFGLFQGGGSRSCSYSVTPPAVASGIQEFTGTVSSDGRLATIGGSALTGSRIEGALPPKSGDPANFRNIQQQANGAMRLEVVGPADQQYLLEVSSDLKNWTPVAPVFLPDGRITYEDGSNSNQKQRFYRTRLP